MLLHGLWHSILILYMVSQFKIIAGLCQTFFLRRQKRKKPWRETKDSGKLFLWLVKSFWLNYAYQLAL